MKKTLLLTGVLLALSASLAAAAGLNLGWTLSCPTVTNVVDTSFPCDDNSLSFTIIGSAVAPAGLSKVTAEELVFDLQEAGGVLSPWWHLEDVGASTPGGCRGSDPITNPTGSLSLTAAFTGASTTVCKNYWGSSASGGQNYVPGYGGPDRARLQGVFARTASGAGALTFGVQYYVANINLDTQHTVPDPTDPTIYVCPGCQDGVCIVFNSCKFDQPPGTANGDITVDTQATRQFVTWQGAVGIGPNQCPTATPTHRATWGKVKSLYR
jgi:hypothetical protein